MSNTFYDEWRQYAVSDERPEILGLFAIADAIYALSNAIQEASASKSQDTAFMTAGLDRISESVAYISDPLDRIANLLENES